MITFSITKNDIHFIFQISGGETPVIVLQNPAGGEAPVTPKDKPVHPPGPPPTSSPVDKSPEKSAPGTGGKKVSKYRTAVIFTVR